MAESYDVCLSFAGEQRGYVGEVADLLRASGVRVFYDNYETATLWGKDLATYLDEIYNHRSTYCILFASEDYVRKMWTNHERVSALDRAMRQRDDYVLPVRFDDAKVPGLRGSTGHLDARQLSPAQVVDTMLAKLGGTPAASAVPACVLVLSADEQIDLGAVLDAAATESGIRIGTATQRSKRLVATVPLTDVTPLDVLTGLVPAIESMLEKRRGARLVIGVHLGEVPGCDNWSCVDVTTTVDATEAASVREVLSLATNADCAVVVSQRLYEEVVRRGRGGIKPGSYIGVPLPDGTTGWVRVPGYLKPPHPGAELPAAEPGNILHRHVQIGDGNTQITGDNPVFHNPTWGRNG